MDAIRRRDWQSLQDHYDSDIWNLVSKMIDEDPSNRISAYRVAGHRSLRSADDTILLTT